jgi:hypothetical protein
MKITSPTTNKAFKALKMKGFLKKIPNNPLKIKKHLSGRP